MIRAGLRVIAINFALFCALLVTVELLGQAYYWWTLGHPLFRKATIEARNSLYEPHPYLAVRLKKNHYSNNYQGGKTVSTTGRHTRATGAPERDRELVRVAVLGGSTTFGTGVSDDESWPYRLQQALGPGYAVYNFGVPGYSTAEAIIQMALQVPEVRPDVVVYYMGWNDIHNYHDGLADPDYYRHGMDHYRSMRIHPPMEKPILDRLYEISSIVHLAINKGRRWLDRPDQPAGRPGPLSYPDRNVDRLFQRNLRTLGRLADQLGARALFVPQVLNTAAYARSDEPSPWSPQVSSVAMPQLLMRFNGLTRSVAQEVAGDAYLDSVDREPWPAGLFLDRGHFNREGNEKFARLVASRVRSMVGPAAEGVPRIAVASTTAAELLELLRRVVERQVAMPAHDDTWWINGVFYAGLSALIDLPGGARYREVIRNLGERTGWAVGRLGNADDLAISQAYLHHYQATGDRAAVGPTLARLAQESAAGTPGRELWHWEDALFMEPAVWAQAAVLEKEPRYLEVMDTLWWDAVDHLYDPEQRLFYRDARYFELRERNGEKVFWGRGNGWVAAGLARVLEFMPVDFSARERYLGLYRSFIERVVELQQADGTWRTSLLDPDRYAVGESSATALFCYAIAWGVNRGILEDERYRRSVERAWEALVSAVEENGDLGWVQREIHEPGPVSRWDRWAYGVGALLLAGAEVYRMGDAAR